MLGQVPEYRLSERFQVALFGLLAFCQDCVESVSCSSVRDGPRAESWRERNGARAGTSPGEMVKAIRQGCSQRTQVSDGDTCRMLQTRPHFILRQMKDQIVCAETRNVSSGVNSFEMIVEIIGQKNGL